MIKLLRLGTAIALAGPIAIVAATESSAFPLHDLAVKAAAPVFTTEVRHRPTTGAAGPLRPGWGYGNDWTYQGYYWRYPTYSYWGPVYAYRGYPAWTWYATPYQYEYWW
jgi:hypothetical protein